MRKISCLVIFTLLWISRVVAQSPNASINGIVLDPSGAPIPDAQIIVVNDLTRLQYSAQTNSEGIYVVTGLLPGPYRLQVSKPGFKTLIKPEITLSVQDALSINFTLMLGAVSEIVTVTGGSPMIDTTDATVSTVVDRQFAENLPMNGRSFQALIQLTPGVVLTPSTVNDGGQFSVNGQRTSSNYWIVDGVSANIGMGTSAIPGNGFGGSLGSFSVLGGTNSLVSVDALQEFRIQTSTYAPEFGRTPGAQISILTRSGTNQFHGTLFDYLRNDALDADDWFANSVGLPKPRERQNDFGATVGGPIIKDRTFFFFSYEGLRLRLPQTTLTTVPCDSTCAVSGDVRDLATPAMQPFLKAFPFPNGPEALTIGPNGTAVPTGSAQFNATYSDPATLDAYSLRIDHKMTKNWTLFGRYNYSPSQISQRGGTGFSLNTVASSRILTQTATAGATWIVSPRMSNDLRINLSRTDASGYLYEDNFGGAVPLKSPPFPTGFDTQNSLFNLLIFSLNNGVLLSEGKEAANRQTQFNVVDGFSMQVGGHALKFGLDYRRLSPMTGPRAYTQSTDFTNVQSAEAGQPFFSSVSTSQGAALDFNNLGIFAQDTWRLNPRLTATYGLRWDVDFAPTSRSGPNLPAVTGFDLSNLSNLALAPLGTPPFNTGYANLAPRLGVAYEISPTPGLQTVLRGGIGIFYDLVTSQVGNAFNYTEYPFGAQSSILGGIFPLSPVAAAPPAILPPDATRGVLYAFDPNLQLPYTLQWNVALEQGLGEQQTLSVTYLGASGRRLLQTANISFPNPLSSRIPAR